MSNPKIKFVVTPPPDADVENSDASYTDTVSSGGLLVLPDSQINVNSVDSGDVVSVKTIDVNITDGVDPVTPTSVGLVGNTLTIEVPSGGGTFDVDLVDRFGNAFPTKQVTANATWDLRTLTPFDLADLFLSRESSWGVSGSYTDIVAENAIIDLVDDLVNAGIWEKLHFLLPFVGGTAAKHSWNLKYPFNNRHSFNATFLGSPTQNGLGMACSGTNGLFLGYSPSNIKSGYEFHFGLYSQGGAPTAGFITDMGFNTGLNSGFYVSLVYNSQLNHRAGIFSAQASSYTGSDAGYFVGNRLGSSFRSIRNGTNLINETTTADGSTVLPVSSIITLGGTNTNNGGITAGVARTYSTFHIGDGLTSQNITDIYTIMHDFNTALGRAQL
jgi:hypothetical protein